VPLRNADKVVARALKRQAMGSSDKFVARYIYEESYDGKELYAEM
jgi:hypothetical protein